MHVVCLDLEGVLVPEIWIEFSKATGLDELKITTRDEPDYDKLMRFRIGVLAREGLKLADIQRVIGGMDPLPGARAFMDELRSLTQVIILSDTFTQFAAPLMAKLGYPTLFCNELIVGPDGTVTGYSLRQSDGKRKAVEALK
ncbi:MAG TPA: bifunctional phosphoserine phosphatase/homoserine phosphotransferase ThrH, partial [Treponemataceae bacterium]|nr:bifunctional phosphoserine phosphatase/homoserine phosphotransferase ThrH [Treponemataceae bacterium]